MIVVVFFQALSFYVIKTYDWFVPFVFDPSNTVSYSCYENYAVFCVSMFQYITMAIVFSKGRPYRRTIFTNDYLTISLLVMVLVCVYITVYPANWIVEGLELQIPPYFNGRYQILILGLLNFIVCLFVEDFIVDFVLLRVKKKIDKVCTPTHSEIDRELKLNQSWSSCVVNELK